MLLRKVIFALPGPVQRQHLVFMWRVEYRSLRLKYAMEVKGNIWRSACCIFRRLEEHFVGVYCRPFSGAVWRAWGILEVDFES